MSRINSDRRIDYAGSVHDDREIEAVVQVLRGGPTAMRIGKNVKAMERRVADLFEKMRGVMWNSGSSALYLAYEASDLQPGEEAAWVILLEAELRALDHYEPVLGLPDTLKAKALLPVREAWIAAIATQGRELSFDFDAPLDALKQQEATSWKPLRNVGARSYPVLEAGAAANFRTQMNQEVAQLIRSSFPSLKDSDKPEPTSA
jgi:hypothetical protein